MVKAKYGHIRARAGRERIRVTRDTTFLFLNYSPEGSKDGRRELLVLLCVALLSKWGRLTGVEFALGRHSACVDWLLGEGCWGSPGPGEREGRSLQSSSLLALAYLPHPWSGH